MRNRNQMIEDPVVKLDAALLKRSDSTPENTEPLTMTGESQLFADDYLIAHKTSVHRRLNRPQKSRDPLLVKDQPWEGQGVVYGCVIPHEEQYRLYYKVEPSMHDYDCAKYLEKHGYGNYLICMAQSADARVFEKPPIEGGAHAGTNIVIDDLIDDFTIFKDEDEPDESRRFKLLSSRGNWWAGLTPATSPDGIHWTWGKDNAVTFFGDRCSYWHDPINGKHVAWSRNYKLMGGRVIVHKETADFDNWSDERESHPMLVIQPDRNDHEQVQFYGGYAFWYRSMYFAYLEVYYLQHHRIDTQLCCSRDGRTWTRLCDRDVFLPNGEHGEFDAYWVVPTFNVPILEDGKLLIHYGGRREPHPQPGFSSVSPGMGGAFALSTLREDGFVSLDATGGEGGVVETHPLKTPDNWTTLEVNCCPFSNRPETPPMDAKVEILSDNGETLAAYAIRPASDPDQVWYSITPEQTLPEVLRLRFRLTNTRLYSFRFR